MRRAFVAIGVVLCALAGCETSAEHERRSGPTEVEAPRNDVSETSGRDVRGRRDSISEVVDGGEAGGAEPQYAYLCRNASDEYVEPPERTGAFEKPDSKWGIEEPPTRESEGGHYGGGSSFPRAAYSLQFPERYEPDADMKRFYLNRGEDFQFHLVTIHGDGQNLEGAELTVTVLLNSRPVPAEYVHWNDSRTEKIRTVRDTGAQLDIDSEVHLLDICIAADQFREGFVHDLHLVFRVDGGLALNNHIRRKILYYGGYERRRHRCLPFGSKTPASELELDLFQQPQIGQAGIHPEGELERAAAEKFIHTDPGERLTIDYAVYTVGLREPTPFALVPIFEGRPLNWRRFVVGPPPSGIPLDAVDRGDFEVRMPDEPGRYELHLATLQNPFLLPSDAAHYEVPFVESRQVLSGSNTLRFEVGDPDDS